MKVTTGAVSSRTWSRSPFCVRFEIRYRNERISISRCCSRCHGTSCRRNSHCKTATTRSTARERGKRRRLSARTVWEATRGWKHTLSRGAGCAHARASYYLGHTTRDLFDFDQDDIRCIYNDSESAIVRKVCQFFRILISWFRTSRAYFK